MLKWVFSITFVCLTLFCVSAYSAEPTLVGAWEFNDPKSPLRATVGHDLEAFGGFEVVVGPEGSDHALRLGKGQHLICRSGLAPSATQHRVNTYTLLLDIRTTLKDSYTALFQTDETNVSDNDCEMTGRARAIGIGETGYSSADTLLPNRWMRIVIAVSNEIGRYDIYVNGERVLRGFAQPMDGRLSLGDALLVLGDNDGDDNLVDIARLAVYDADLSDAAIAALGSAIPDDSENTPPSTITAGQNTYTVSTGESIGLDLTIEDPQRDDLQYEVDWGDGVVRHWKEYARAGQSFSLAHSYHIAASWEVKARARDEHGAISEWTRVATAAVNGEPTVAMLTKPFLQNVKVDGISIMWESNSPLSFVLEYGPSLEKAVLSRTSTPFDSFIYKAVIEGLQPDSDYTFQVNSDIGALAYQGTFTTAPVEPRAFSFSVWGDSQGDNHGAYDADPYEPTKAMMQHMAASKIDFGVACGDMAEDGSSYDDTRQFHLDRVAKYLGTEKPYFIAWGNHDARKGSILRAFADQPSKKREGFTAGFGSFSFDYAGSHFICIDFATGTNDIRTWLEDDLQSAANQNGQFTFLFVHLPPFCELWYDGDAELRQMLVPLMERYGVDACFSGHTHEYERGELNGVHYVITGGGSWLDNEEKIAKDWPHMTVGGAHDLPGRRHGLVNEYVTVYVEKNAWRAETHAFEPDGSYIGVIDEFGSGR